MAGASPDTLHPMEGFDRVCYLKPAVADVPHIEAGDYSYCDAPNGIEEFIANVRYSFPHIGDKLIIGKFCSIAHGSVFIMNGANHATGGFSTYPFFIFGFGGAWDHPPCEPPYKGNTVIGHDVWIGCHATFMPGIKVGNGAVIGANSVVTRDVPPYTIVGGNPAEVIRSRFSPDVILRLNAVAWWDWPIDKIAHHVDDITGADIETLEAANHCQ